jgi:hypothetical protein
MKKTITTKPGLGKTDKIMIGLIIMTIALAISVVAIAAIAGKLNLN